MSKVIVVGGGAAGMMAAIAAGNAGHEVVLLEKNEKLGKKIYITGKGRCNFTNASPIEEYFPNIVCNHKFLYSALYTYTNDSVMDFMESHGTKIKVERGNRAFPVSDHASDITKALSNGLNEANVKVMLNTEVADLLTVTGSEGKQIAGVKLKDRTEIYADAVVVATGGFSYQTTGSTGDGYEFAKNVGHKVTEIYPALVPFETKESYITDMQGLSLKNVSLTIWGKNKKLYSEFGEMLFTHFGVSGPLVLTASSFLTKKLRELGEFKAEIDLKPALDEEQLDNRLLREFEQNQNKTISNVMVKVIPSKMVPVFLDIIKVSHDKKVNEISKESRKLMVNTLKHFPFTITGTRDFKEAIVTQGGVAVKEIDPSTMESKLVKGLYFSGEVIDVDALTGGYNLQIAFSTGYLAGSNIL